MLRAALSGLTILTTLSVAACMQSDGDMVQLILPEGNAIAGRQAFMDLGCTTCHTVRGEEALRPPEAAKSFELGPSLAGLSRGGIATQVIAPKHVDAEAADLRTDWEPGQRVWLGPVQDLSEGDEAAARSVSRMTDYGTVMTVRQLTDLVAFLQGAAEAE